MVADAKSLVEADTLVERDGGDVDALAVLVAESKLEESLGLIVEKTN